MGLDKEMSKIQQFTETTEALVRRDMLIFCLQLQQYQIQLRY